VVGQAGPRGSGTHGIKKQGELSRRGRKGRGASERSEPRCGGGWMIFSGQGPEEPTNLAPAKIAFAAASV